MLAVLAPAMQSLNLERPVTKRVQTLIEAEQKFQFASSAALSVWHSALVRAGKRRSVLKNWMTVKSNLVLLRLPRTRRDWMSRQPRGKRQSSRLTTPWKRGVGRMR